MSGGLINRINPNNYNSFCLDRMNIGNLKIEYLVSEVQKISKNNTIIQADGIPMSGGIDDYNTTLQAISTADIINKKFNMYVDKNHIPFNRVYYPMDNSKNIHIFVSGGTNSKTTELADITGVRVSGVSIGSYARELVKDFILNDDLVKNTDLLFTAYEIARNLVLKNIKNE